MRSQKLNQKLLVAHYRKLAPHGSEFDENALAQVVEACLQRHLKVLLAAAVSLYVVAALALVYVAHIVVNALPTYDHL